MGRCNLCRLNDLKYQARQRGLTVTVIYGEPASAYVHPPHISSLSIRLFPERHEQYKRGGYMRLPEYCCCDD